MNQLYIPAYGDRIVLTQPWTFDCVGSFKNVKFLHSLGLVKKDPTWNDLYDQGFKKFPVTLPAGMVLECTRIVISQSTSLAISRGWSEDTYFDYMSWRVVVDGKPKNNQKFLIKLNNYNHIIFQLINTYKKHLQKKNKP